MPAASEAIEALPGDGRVQDEVRRFYDSVGWQRVGPGVFQNARYEDLRPVSQEYIRRCRRRVLRHLRPEGRFLLDGGSGPIQYPEYLEYSAGYRSRVCVDLSGRALREARERIGAHGLYVVADIARLPFPAGFADGVVSLHTLHHLSPAEQRAALTDLTRVLAPGASAVVVYGWGPGAPIGRWTRLPIRLASAVVRAYGRLRRRPTPPAAAVVGAAPQPRGTLTFKHGHAWLVENTRHLPDVEVLTWRSVGTNFLRTFIHERLLGRGWLRLLYRLEELWPHWFGRHGQYPLIVIRKPAAATRVQGEG
jgi:ubiquinone/menaquinone biosynthesis C-methylase UbiE